MCALRPICTVIFGEKREKRIIIIYMCLVHVHIYAHMYICTRTHSRENRGQLRVFHHIVLQIMQSVKNLFMVVILVLSLCRAFYGTQCVSIKLLSSSYWRYNNISAQPTCGLMRVHYVISQDARCKMLNHQLIMRR